MRLGRRPAARDTAALVPLVARGSAVVADALGRLIGEPVASSESGPVEVSRLAPPPGGSLLFVPVAGGAGGVVVSIGEALARRRPASWPAAPAGAVQAEIANILASKLLGAVGERLSELLLPEPPVALAGPAFLRDLEGLGAVRPGSSLAAVTLRCRDGELLVRLGLVLSHGP